MGLLARDGLVREYDVMPDILRDQTPIRRGGVCQLCRVRDLKVPHFVSTDRVDSSLTESFGDLRRQVLVQVELHALRAGRRVLP